MKTIILKMLKSIEHGINWIETKIDPLDSTYFQSIMDEQMGNPEKKILSEFQIAHKRWVESKGDLVYRLNYDLNENSIVFDIGGYEGQWASDIFAKYQCNIFIFEPVNEFYQFIRERFSGNPKIKVFNFGISNKTYSNKIFLGENTSSTFFEVSNKFEIVQMIDIVELLKKEKIDNIDLMKINIEGGEYDLLGRLISSGRINQIKDIQIQFHNFVPNPYERRKKIQKSLLSTHHITYEFPFIWESWRINDK